MVRGVSRQIIEVPDTGNIYYEKAYLVVKPEFSDDSARCWRKRPSVFCVQWMPLQVSNERIKNG